MDDVGRSAGLQLDVQRGPERAAAGRQRAAAAAADAKKKEEDAFKKKAQEEAKLKAEEALKKNQGKDKAPIRFKDAVGRKFSFPFHLCQTWQVCTNAKLWDPDFPKCYSPCCPFFGHDR